MLAEEVPGFIHEKRMRVFARRNRFKPVFSVELPDRVGLNIAEVDIALAVYDDAPTRMREGTSPTKANDNREPDAKAQGSRGPKGLIEMLRLSRFAAGPCHLCVVSPRLRLCVIACHSNHTVSISSFHASSVF